MSIPKKIHWCWLSGDPLPPKIQRCVESWKRIMPDYEIVCWDKKRFDIDSVPFVKQAYACRKYAFAADYIRLYALYEEGGIYLDSDVRVFERFDRFLDHGAFSSVEFVKEMFMDRSDKDWYCRHLGYGIQCAVMGAEKGNAYIKDCLSYYIDKHIEVKEGRIVGIHVIPAIAAKIAYERYGFVYDDFSDTPQHLEAGLVIYPSYVFSALYGDVRLSTVCIHLAEQAWNMGKRKMTLLQKGYAYLLSNSRFWGWLHYKRKELTNKFKS